MQTDADAQAWRAAGVGWVGGTLAGVRSKLGYLARLGVTALWVSPVLRQAAPAPGAVASNYHGYATQDFLAVDPRFGDADALRALVDDAHAAGLRVILDVVLNHAGDVFAYDRRCSTRAGTAASTRWRAGGPRRASCRSPPRPQPRPGRTARCTRPSCTRRRASPAAAGSSTGTGTPSTSRATSRGSRTSPTAAAGSTTTGRRPRSRRSPGRTAGGWRSPTSTGSGSTPSSTWIRGATRYFASVVHEFAQSIGKDRFLLVGEITGSREDAIATMELTGLDAALGLAEVQSRLVGAATGAEDPAGLLRAVPQLRADRQGLAHLAARHGRHGHRRPRPGPAGAGEGPAGRDGRGPELRRRASRSTR